MKKAKTIKVKFVKDEVYPLYDVGFEEFTDGIVELPEDFYRKFYALNKQFFHYQEIFEAFVENPKCKKCGFATFYDDKRVTDFDDLVKKGLVMKIPVSTKEYKSWYECYKCHTKEVRK